jgi:hypothetical protein
MGLLDEPGLDRLVTGGCSKCASPKLSFRSYVDGLLPLQGGEPVGRLSWVYDGEKFVDGVYEVTCADCAQTLFSADVCPRCHAAGGLQRALGTPNRWPVLAKCPECEGEDVGYVAFVPARVSYEGRRADKARSVIEIQDDGFHGYRATCRDCGVVAERTDACPLCDAPGPLRPRPG